MKSPLRSAAEPQGQHALAPAIRVHASDVPPPGVAPAPSTSRTTLDAFISRLLELQAKGAGNFPVVIETRSRMGEVIYGVANARRDHLYWVGSGYRGVSTAGEPKEVVRIG